MSGGSKFEYLWQVSYSTQCTECIVYTHSTQYQGITLIITPGWYQVQEACPPPRTPVHLTADGLGGDSDK